MQEDKVRMPDFARARDCLTGGNVGEALLEFERCIQEGVAPITARFYYGLCWYRLDEFDTAAGAFEEVVRQQPRDHIAHFYAGLCYEHLGRAADAERSRRIAYRMDPAPGDDGGGTRP